MSNPHVLIYCRPIHESLEAGEAKVSTASRTENVVATFRPLHRGAAIRASLDLRDGIVLVHVYEALLRGVLEVLAGPTWVVWSSAVGADDERAAFAELQAWCRVGGCGLEKVFAGARWAFEQKVRYGPRVGTHRASHESLEEGRVDLANYLFALPLGPAPIIVADAMNWRLLRA